MGLRIRVLLFLWGPGVEEEIILHVLNDGNETLKLSAPALTNAGPEYSIDLLGLSGDIQIEPNHELQIIVRYTGPAVYSNSTAELTLQSNDPNSSSCSFEFEVGGPSGIGFSVSDPCGCDNIIPANNAFGFLFRDTLIITAGGGGTANVILGTNTNGFLDAAGVLFPFGTLLGSLSPATPIKFVFYRPPNVPLDIVTNIVATITSPACTGFCPLIPTLSQWGIISLALLLLIFGITAIRERKTA